MYLSLSRDILYKLHINNQHFSVSSWGNKQRRNRDSNSGPLDVKSDAISTELSGDLI